jgi:c-di-GMP-binding flagellar brake protein YcgR
VPVVIVNRPTSSTERAGFLNEQLRIEVTRIGSDTVMPSTLEVMHIGYALGVRPGDDLADLDDFQPNDSVRVRFSRPHDATYEFASRVTEVDGHGGLLWLTAPVNIERIQARRHVRVAAALAGEVAPAGPRRLDAGAAAYHSVRITDISAGGVAIRSQDVLPNGTVVLVDAKIPDRQGSLAVQARALVVRSAIDSGPDEPTCYRYGLAYLDLGSRQEAQLVASVFWQLSQQRLA